MTDHDGRAQTQHRECFIISCVHEKVLKNTALANIRCDMLPSFSGFAFPLARRPGPVALPWAQAATLSP